MKSRNLIAPAVAVALLLAGCGDNGAGAADPDGKISLTYAIFSPDQQDAMQDVIDEFMKENKDIEVKLQVTPWTDYWTTLQNSTAGGTGPDVAWMLGAKLGAYVDGGAVLPLDDAITASGVDVSKYPESLVKLFDRDGKQYALPKDFDTIGLWYNKVLFDEAGVAYPDDTWTWDTVRENAKTLTKPDGSVYGIVAPLEAQAGYYNTIYQAGGEVISKDGKKSGYDDPATIEGIKFWTDIINVDKSSPSLASISDTEGVAQFMSGRVAMFYSGSYFAKRFADDEYTAKNADVAKLPKGKVDATIINGLGNVALASSKNPDAAKKLAVFLSGEKASKIQSETGTVVGSYEGSQTAWVEAAPQFNLQVFLDQVPNAVVLPVSNDTDAWATKESEIFTPAWTGEKTPEEVGSELAKIMNEALAKE